MSILRHRMAVIGGKSHNRIPLKMLKAIPAGFPLPLHDDMFGGAGHSNAIFSNIQSAGEDLRAFTDVNLASEIPIEIVAITTGSNLIKGFIRVPSALSINDKIYLRTTVGGGESAYAAGSTNGSEAVWQDYNLVIHGSDVTADATGTHTVANTGGVSKSGASLLNAWPAYGFGAREGTASTDRITVTNGGDSALRSDSLVFYKDATEDLTTGRFFNWVVNSGNLSRKASTDDSDCSRADGINGQNYNTTAGEITGGAWHGLFVSWPAIGTAPFGRVDGAAPTSPTVEAGSGTHNLGSGNLVIMNRNDAGRPFDGRLAAFRMRPDNTPDNAWFDLEWDSYNNPGSIAEAEALIVV